MKAVSPIGVVCEIQTNFARPPSARGENICVALVTAAEIWAIFFWTPSARDENVVRRFGYRSRDSENFRVGAFGASSGPEIRSI